MSLEAGGSIDAVVVTYNSELDLPGLVSCAPIRAEFNRLIIVDNASNDASVEIARGAGAEVIEQKANVGFGAGVNDGMRHASGPIVCVLNPDIRFPAVGVISRLVKWFDDPRVAIVTPTLLLPSGREQDSARTIPTPLDLVLRRLTRRDLGRVSTDHAVAAPWVVGAFLMVRREAFDAVGGFDERFRLYFEDVDLCVRLQQRGWRVVFDPTVRIHHHHRASSRQSLFGWSTRQHIASALRFYSRYPRHLILRDPKRSGARLTAGERAPV